VEIPSTDFERAVEFYQQLLLLEFNIVEGELEKMAFFPGGEGAISFSPGFNPSRDGVLVSLNARKDMDPVLARVKEQGGRIEKPKTKIQGEGMGFFALFIDSEGNRIGLYQA
jgi:predicted enzyme related to lactoylglutathione lyase